MGHWALGMGNWGLLFPLVSLSPCLLVSLSPCPLISLIPNPSSIRQYNW
ncbi:hypothetical protein FDUTEX481_06059 [Tolypothrix sp. PCC 7601]|nr:hypothetical protein FDUTEX481_06059 [Tolypothrix sp. PCC 7601]